MKMYSRYVADLRTHCWTEMDGGPDFKYGEEPWGDPSKYRIVTEDAPPDVIAATTSAKKIIDAKDRLKKIDYKKISHTELADAMQDLLLVLKLMD